MPRSAVVLWAVIIGVGVTEGCGDTGSDPSQHAVLWQHGGVRLEADDFYVEIEGTGLRFLADVPGVTVGGNTGNTTFKTLELQWTEHGTEMRLFIYFEADSISWHSYEIRTYDGAPNGDGTRWVYYYGPFFTTAVGAPFVGDVDLTSDGSDNGVVGHLHFTNLRLTAF